MKLISLILFSIILVGCSKTENSVDKSNSKVDSVQLNEIINDFEKQITEKYWKLVLLKNKKIEFGENQKKQTHFILKSEESRVTGNTGCNNFSGTFKLSTNNEISFKPFAVTRMACPDINYENDFLKVFDSTKSFKIIKDTLELYDNSQIRLAKFEVVYFD